MSKPVEANQLDYVDMQHVDMQPLLIANQPECVDVPQPQESNQPEYTDMSSLLNANRPEANQPENVVVSRSQEPTTSGVEPA
jgi:hypothetical protein